MKLVRFIWLNIAFQCQLLPSAAHAEDSNLAATFEDTEVQDAILDCHESGGGVIIPVVVTSDCVLTYQPKATASNPFPRWKIHPNTLTNNFLGFGGSAYYAEAAIHGGFDLSGQTVTIHRLLQDGIALRNYFTLGNGELQIQHRSTNRDDHDARGVVYYALIPNSKVRQDSEWGFDHTEAISKFNLTDTPLSDESLLDQVRTRCRGSEKMGDEPFVQFDSTDCQRYLSAAEMLEFQKRDEEISARLGRIKSVEDLKPKDLKELFETEIVSAKLLCPVSKVDAPNSMNGELKGLAKCYLSYSIFNSALNKNIWNFFPYFVNFHYSGTDAFAVGAAARGELSGEFGFLNQTKPVRLRNLFWRRSESRQSRNS